MKKHSLLSALTLSALLVAGGVATAQNTTGKALRDGAIADTLPAEEVHHQDTKRFVRNYRQQPPLIPHSIQQYQIDRNANECLACHDWSNAGDRGAPTLSMTHYQDRNGNQLDAVAGTRWFCNQCHVPQADTPALVDNEFQPSH